MNKTILSTGALLGLLAVLLGAFGAHSLKDIVDADALHSFETGVKYQMYHALLLLFTGITKDIGMKRKKIMYFLIVTGIILFSGSVYGLATNNLSTFNFKKTALLTPVGGTLLIIAWGLLFFNLIKSTVKIK